MKVVHITILVTLLVVANSVWAAFFYKVNQLGWLDSIFTSKDSLNHNSSNTLPSELQTNIQDISMQNSHISVLSLLIIILAISAISITIYYFNKRKTK
ncbi:hypothetical protein [Bacillus sp. Marseille-P3661]|uniref:hypothetical protein n=1 Tax=Bacillus sp. Marseille-P3661 TaxID=1936234 RepID=UPI000C841422|nr:hypothetical protein [Bacillus sp. Marseille-P3661]